MDKFVLNHWITLKKQPYNIIMESRKILVIGSSNTDMTVKADKLPSPGETVLGGSFSMGYGGKGANQAIAAKRLGGDVSFVCKVGRDSFGEMSLAKYRSEGLDISGILYSGRPSGVALITVDASAENSIVVASGANADVTVQDMRDLAPVIAASSILLLQLEIPLDAVVEAARIAYGAGVYVVLNPAPACGKSLPEELYRYVSLIIPNETEISLLTGICADSVDSAHTAALRLRSRGARSVIVTLGSKGALVCGDGSVELVPARKVDAVDTTAAGDTFCGALCVALSEGRGIAESVRFATAASSLSVTRIGALDSIPFRAEVNAIA